MSEIVVQGHRGLQLKSANIFSEKADPEFSLRASDVVFDLENSAYVNKGFGGFAQPVVAVDPRLCNSLFYSYVYDVMMFCENGNLTIVSADTGAVIQILTAAFAAGVVLSYADWPATEKLYISDGSAYNRLDVTAGVYSITNLTSTYSAGTQIIVWNGRMWAIEPQGQVCFAFPSNSLDPETFNPVNGIRLVEDGPHFTAMSANDQVLFIHKSDTILAITGDPATGLQLRNLKTQRGAVSKTAICTFEKVDYFIAYDGFYRFNGVTLEPIHSNISAILGNLFSYINVTFPGTRTPIDGSLFNYAVPLVPLWQPDFGRRYILFACQFGAGQAFATVFKFDLDFQDWTVLFDGYNIALTSLAYSSLRVKTYLMYKNATNLSVFYDTDTYNGVTLVGKYATAQLTGGAWYIEKQYEFVQFFPNVFSTTKVFIDMNGVNTYSIQINDGIINKPGYTGLSLPRFATAFMLSIGIQVVGGGQLISSGFALMANPEEDRSLRSYNASTQDVINGVIAMQQATDAASNGFHAAGGGSGFARAAGYALISLMSVLASGYIQN